MTDFDGKAEIESENTVLGASSGEKTLIPMRDGVNLVSDIYFPDGPGPWPAIIIRHPYGQPPHDQSLHQRVADDGFVFVHQQSRGRFGSEGEFTDPYHVEANDGEDAVSWIADQDWCTGKVGIMGTSYAGATTWMATMRQPKGLVASIPLNACHPWDAFPYVSNGVCCLDALVMWSSAIVAQWTASQKPEILKTLSKEFQCSTDLTAQTVKLTLDSISCEEEERAGLLKKVAALTEEQNQLMSNMVSGSLVSFLKQMEKMEPWVRRWAEHQTRDDPYWAPVDWINFSAEIHTPVLIVAGWYDTFTCAALDSFEELSKNPGSGAKHRLIVGPWAHASLSELTDKGVVAGERVFPLDQYSDDWSLYNQTSHLDAPQLFKRWFFQHLKGEESGLMDDAPVRLYVMGENVWRNEQEWPLSRTQWTNFYFHSNDGANSARGDGTLDENTPEDESPDSFEYDPKDPVPSIGGRWLQPPLGGPRDRRTVQEREDVLVYSTDALKEAIEVTGSPKVKLWISTTAVDTDFTATLCDVQPDGTAYILCDGVTRLRFRENKPGLLTPGEMQEVEIELFPTSNLFKAGHRIRLEISSSNGYYFDPNPNTGQSLLWDEDQKMLVATQNVFHDRHRPSHVSLPIIPR